MTPASLLMLLMIVVALLGVDLALWLRLRQIERDPGSKDDFT